MKYVKSSQPKYIKYSYRNKEFIWVKVRDFDGVYYYGEIDNKPITKSIKLGDKVKINKNKVMDVIK